MKIAIMQPYIFPYIGYFQLINATDIFVFYDDVNFIKRGWINRNRLLINGEAQLFTVPVSKASQNKLINEVEVSIEEKWLKKFLSTLQFNYKKAPHFEETSALIKKVLDTNHSTIADLAMDSVKKIANHLQLSTVFKKSSEQYSQSKGMDKADRLIEICKQNNASDYVNPSGGKELYDKLYFKEQDVNLYFIENKINPYPQFTTNFVGGLSMIDVLMFNSKEQIQEMLNEYSLV